MRLEIRLLEEWKANNELVKFHEDLKQKRFTHSLSIQAAFLAVFGLLARDAMDNVSMVSLTALVLVSAPPLLTAYYFMLGDRRSRAAIETTQTRLLLIEEEWANRFPANHFSTYQQRFDVLSRRQETMIEKYADARKLDKESYRSLVHSRSAHASEHAVLRLFWYLWIVLASMVILIHAAWHLVNGSWTIA